MTASQTYRAVRIPGHTQQLFASMAMWRALRNHAKSRPFKIETIRRNQFRISKALANLELQLQGSGSKAV